MTTHYIDGESEAILAAGLSAAERIREQIAAIERAKASQPERLAKARADADGARSKCLADEPWSESWSAIPTTDFNGQLTGMMALPSIDGKELWGTRAAFDFLDAGADPDRIDEVLNRYFTALDGQTEHLFFVFSAALTTIAQYVVPMMLDDLEQHGSNYDARVLLADAARNAWATRLNAGKLSGGQDD
ncbi:hypothetical protein BN1232_02249 [Mycobacterium lentiflavum]|uniref:Uncharacterized protein n=1 Tax=Mycobacterium lentiflavum TaxID=141349 RepID=A0A0E3WC38_MYCLN|nr:hypothetical protein [Mycobacterium lentiflavum]CQD11925.1 hypothetical protein BN1232_02249 [Mycobacterium lentiflavum]